MTENSSEILHHGRDREALVEIASQPEWSDITEYDISLLSEIEQGFIAAYFMQLKLTPKDETVVSIASILKEVDFDKEAEATEFSNYTPKEIQDALNRYQHCSAIKNPELKSWLNGRGVTDEQIEKYQMLDMFAIDDRRARICLGVEIHPVLQRWIGHSHPLGIIIPTKNENGEFNGCHCRFLSTVPKVKFGAAIPTMHIQTNLKKGDYPEALVFVEGVFDGLAIESSSPEWNFISPSSGFWTPEQIFITYKRIKHLKGKTKLIMAHDMDRVGLKTSLIVGALFAVLGFDIEFAEWNSEFKDPAELIFKGHRDFKNSVVFISPQDMIKKYNSKPYQPVVEYSSYLDHRHASYNNLNYSWVKEN